MATAAGRSPSPATSRSRLLLERAGRMPLPPYIAGKRDADAHDRDDYQTMFAARDGAVAAPTAALHFTPELMAASPMPGSGTRR